MLYEELLNEAFSLGVHVTEETLKGKIGGLYSNNFIWINKHLPSYTDKYCVLAEELGHYHTTEGDILDQSTVSNRQQENRARSWAYERIIPLSKIVQAHQEHIRNKFELADFLGVTETFLNSALDRYLEKYGDAINYKGYIICFEPLDVIEWFDKKI